MKKYNQHNNIDTHQLKTTIWKRIAIIFVALFCIALIIGAVKMYTSKHSYEPIKITDKNIETAKNIVAQELSKRGEDINNYELELGRNMRRTSRGGAQAQRSIIQISLKKKTSLTREVYLINLDENKVIMHSVTEFYEQMPEEQDRNRFPTGRFFVNRE